MSTTVRTIDFLPEIFKTKTNEQFLSATLDQLTQQPNFNKVQGFIGSKFGYGVNNTDAYVAEPSKVRTNYQLEPSVIFKKKDTKKAVDLLTYPGLVDAVALEGGIPKNNNNLFNNEFYSWDSFVDLDKLINYHQYYWLPTGPEAVTLGTISVYTEATFDITSNANGYNFVQNEIPIDGTNPIITLVRGGTYKFNVNQSTNFWIQTEPGVSGVDPVLKNISTRDIYGVTNNGESNGTVTFNVPLANAQNDYLLNGNLDVDLATNLPFEQIHGARIADLKNIDGVTDLNGKTLIFYGIPGGTQGYIGQFLDEGLYDTVLEGIDSNAGVYSTINNHYYKISLIGDPANPVVSLREAGYLQTDQNISIKSGEQFLGRNFVRNSYYEIDLIPVITASLNTLYYRDGTNPLKVGKIVLVDSAGTEYVNVDNIVGAKTYTSPNNITLTNGLKVQFLSNALPEKYRGNQYYVEGVGSSIVLVPVSEMVVPEPYSQTSVTPFDIESYDIHTFGTSYNEPVTQDYITINRAAMNRNAWSRSNRWFHEDVLKLVVASNIRSPKTLEALTSTEARAKRPIVEFYPNLKLFKSGTVAKKPVDFINYSATNAFNEVAGQLTYEPDGSGSAFFEGARVVFANDNALNVRNKIFVVNFVMLTGNTDPVISLSVAPDGNVQYNEQVVCLGGIDNKAQSIYFDGSVWHTAQYKQTVNQTPFFDVFDSNNTSFGDSSLYPGTNFTGSTLFQYAAGTGTNDTVLGFPIKYSSLSNLGDISFECTLNTQTFNYVDGMLSKTVKVGTGYVFNYSDRINYTREIGWQTTVEKSFQYQVFDFMYDSNSLSQTFVCDVRAINPTDTEWSPVVVYVNNNRTSDYTISYSTNTTSITITSTLTYGTPVQVMIYSNQSTSTGYYQIPDNLDQNPFNEEITTVNLGDIRGHYKSICNNLKTLTGTAFGANNYRDLGNVVPYGTRIIQNSAPLPIAATFLRSKDSNFFNSVQYNSTEYIKFKSLLIDTVDRLDLNALQDGSTILDMALDKISSSKIESNPFFWTDMLPLGSPNVTNSYTFKLGAIPSVYSLSRVYDFASANYHGLLVYLTRVVSGVSRVTQLLKDIDYSVSTTDKSLTLLKTDVYPNDILTIKEYSKTYGSFVPSTPTKLGLYPLHLPEIVYDNTYVFPAYFIKGHDGSYTKLHGDLSEGNLQDFRDKALFEFEVRIYNNMKVKAKLPVEYDDVFPGQFRTTNFTYDDVQEMYSISFLNWVGSNRVDYKTQYYTSSDEYTWNYKDSVNKLNNSSVVQGNWKGLYLWLYDTTTPHLTPWEMLGLPSKPLWWDNRYGPLPYTSDNTLLWTDISNGYIWNNGNPYTNEKRKRTGLLQVLPVDQLGKLVLPIQAVLSGYDSSKFKKDWTIGDMSPTEFSYRKSSSWPFDFIRLCALAKPALFFTLGFNLDAYRYNDEFKQYLVENRFRSLTNYAIEYGNDDTTAAHSYLNWLVDYQRQYGVTPTNIFETLKNLDVRLTYRMAGFSDKDLLQFFVEKGSPNSKNSSLLIPDESYSILLYDNQANDVITYSSVIVQKTSNGFKIYGNSQRQSFFTAVVPINNGNYDTVTVNGLSVKVSKNYSTVSYKIPYGTEFTTNRELCEFLKGYGIYLESQGMKFNDIENGLELNWDQMIAETLYWVQSGWEVGSTVNVNPCANSITIDKSSYIVQPLTIQQDNFILNQNLLPIQLKDMHIYRNGTLFSAKALNQGDSISFFTARLSTIEHVVVFDNVTAFNDSIFNLITGLRQQRLYLKGNKSIEWNGTMNASGFIMNQDNITEWVENQKYAKGSIVTYKNSYWVAKDKSAPPSSTFDTTIWVKTNYDQVQKGLLPNPSTRAYESTLYYDANRANLESDGDLLSFSLIGYRPRDYLVQGDLDDSTQVNVYMNMLGSKGTNSAATGLNGITVQHNPLNYSVHENWAIKTSEYGGILNQNFIEITLDELALKGNPSIVSVIKDTAVTGSEQQVSLKDIKNYGRILGDDNILSTIEGVHDDLLPSAGYVNLDDVYATAYTVDRLNNALITDLYKNDYIWIADKASSWEVYSAFAMQINVELVVNNLDGTITIVFDNQHNLVKYDPFGILNFDDRINGFFTVNSVTDLYSVVVTKTVDNAVNTIKGFGLAFKLKSQRVGTAKDINFLSLIQNEYAREKVWVDVSTSGEWAVYEKANNYKDTAFSKPIQTVTFGYSSLYIPELGYFIADPGNNVIHHYQNFGNGYIDVGVITPPTGTNPTTFGISMVRSNNLVLIGDSNPDPNGTSYIFVYKIVKEKLLQTLVFEQMLDAQGIGRYGDVVAISKDNNFIYASILDYGALIVYALNDQLTYRPVDYITPTYAVLAVDIVYNDNQIIVTGDVTSDFVTDAYVTLDISGPPVAGARWGDQTDSPHKIISSTYDSGTDTTTITVVNDITNINQAGTAGDCRVYITIPMILTQDIELNTNYFVVSGDWSTDSAPATIAQGKYVAFENADPSLIANADLYTVLSSRYNSSTNETTFYTIETFQVFHSAGTNVLTASYYFTLFNTADGYIYPLGYTQTSASEGFGISVATNYDGTKIVVGAPYTDLSDAVQDTGAVYVYDLPEETFELEYDGAMGQVAVFYLAWNPVDPQANSITLSPLSVVTLNGKRLTRWLDYVLLPGSGRPILAMDGSRLKAGDVLTIRTTLFARPYIMYSYDDPSQARAGELFGYSVDCNTTASEIIVGAPFDAHNPAKQEGAVHRFTNEGKKYGTLTGLGPTSLTLPDSNPRNIFINGFAVKVTSGNAAHVAEEINKARVDNVYAYATADGRLIISLRDQSLNPSNDKLNLFVTNNDDVNYWNSFRIYPYIRTQVITDEHKQTRAQFGFKVKFNEFNSFAVSAPVATRYIGTTFDFTDDENSHNDAVFDNNLTQWEDVTPNAGAVYMYDYLSTYNESIFNVGEFIYAQSCNDTTDTSGAQSYYGSSLSFNDYVLIIGSPGFIPDTVGGRAVIYKNSLNKQNWSVYRKATNVVDINKIQKVQLYDNLNNTVLESLDYFDPSQGKLLGAVRTNIDFISNKDPAGYNNGSYTGGKVWGNGQVGKIWFNTSTTKFLNYHQDDAVYDSKYWGQVFPGSEVAIYTWVESDVTPSNYIGQGTPYDLTKYSVSYHNDASESLTTTYYYWVKDTNSINTSLGKTLTDTVLRNYITSPQSSGIAYFAPVKPNTFALYNSDEFIRGTNSNLLVNYSLSIGDASNHIEFKLIRTDFPDDFLPGLPNKIKGYDVPYALYDRMLDSLSGTDEVGAIVPDPALPKMVQTGISIRPRQTLVSNRFTALKNYFEFINSVLLQYPIIEIQNLTFLSASSAYVTTADYWNYTDWWATGYSSNTRASYDVARYADLSAIEAPTEGLIVGVAKNIQNKREIYIYTSGAWVRIGLEKGTIQISDSIWDYQTNKIGFGDNFFDSVAFDTYPSVETRYIIRAMNEQVFKGELFKYRNQSLIVLLEYIQSENISNNNYLPWLNKTSLIDVGYTARQLVQSQKYQRDNQTFLEGYIDEIKPYRVVIKDFFLRYEGQDTYDATFTDFDLPSKYNTNSGKFISPQLLYSNYDPKYQFLPSATIWTEADYTQWFASYGLVLRDAPNTMVASLKDYVSFTGTTIYVDNARGLPTQGTLRIGNELISYLSVDRTSGLLVGVTRGVNASTGSEHLAGTPVYMDIPSVNVLYTGRAYTQIPKVVAYIDTTLYPAPRRPAKLKAVLSGDIVIAVETVDPGDGYVVTPEIVFDYSFSVTSNSSTVSVRNHTYTVPTTDFVNGEMIKLKTVGGTSSPITDGYYFIHVIGTTTVVTANDSQIISFHTNHNDALKAVHPISFNPNYDVTGYQYTIGVSAKAVPTIDNNRIRGINTAIKFDRTSYQPKIKTWVSGEFWSSPYNSPATSASTQEVSSSTLPTSTAGSILSVTSVTSDANNNAVAELDYSLTQIKPGQLTGVLVYFTTDDSFVYTDDGGAVIRVSRPKFDPDKVLNSYDYYIDYSHRGAGYSDGDVIIILGSHLGGVDGVNNAVITVTYVGASGEILDSTVSGLPVSSFHSYYLKPYSTTTTNNAKFGVFNNASLTVPVKSADFTFVSGDKLFVPVPIVAGSGYTSDMSSVVTYNNKIWRCIESNNDYEFDYTKWEEISQSDSSINALDRIMAYYSPTVGMPGKDLSQLVDGITYPYNTYVGNSFSPEDQYDLDYTVKDTPFYPSNLKIRGIVPHYVVDIHGNTSIDNYVAVADDVDKTVVLIGDETSWSMIPISHTVLGATDISYVKVSAEEEIYVITTNTKASPLIISFDAINWVTLGNFAPYDTIPWDLNPFALTGLGGNVNPLQGSVCANGKFYAVGDNILKSDDGVNWREIYTFGSALPNTLNDITYIDGIHFSGFVAVGVGSVVTQYPGSAAPVIETRSRIVTSLDGDVWKLDATALTNSALLFVFGTTNAIITGGENGYMWSTVDSTLWSPVTVDTPVTTTLRAGAFGNDTFVVVGDAGTVLYSADGETWTNITSTSNTTVDLYKITFDGNRFMAVGDKDTVITSSDGYTWVNQSNLELQPPEYTITGNEFTFGYGPEELVAGVTNDNLVMRVTSVDGPLETTYTLHVDKTGESHVYRNNDPDNFSLAQALTETSTVVYLNESLTSTITQGNFIVIGAEIIKYRTYDSGTKSLQGITRGAQGTAPTSHSVGSVVYPLSKENMLSDTYYSVVWNSRHDPIHGDPLTQSDTDAAIFLNTV